jgi:hypothetical protein
MPIWQTVVDCDFRGFGFGSTSAMFLQTTDMFEFPWRSPVSQLFFGYQGNDLFRATLVVVLEKEIANTIRLTKQNYTPPYRLQLKLYLKLELNDIFHNILLGRFDTLILTMDYSVYLIWK